MHTGFCISLAALCLFGMSECLTCFDCKNISDPNQCRTTTQCTVGHSCYTETIQNDTMFLYNTGCQNNQLCSSSGVHQMVGRSIQTRQQTTCHECCSTDNCNNLLCAHKKPTDCTDDQAFDCARLNSIFNVCADVHHAKMTCPKFCGLCQLVDGNWATWGDWSTCSVTCDNGTMSRTRTCTNPAPSNGGLNCSGHDVDWKLCTKQLCPVHGNWSSWSAWSDCSVSCDVGLRKKTRTCTNPKPDRFGDYCYGDASEYSICQMVPCINPVHGNWSSWSAWSDCSVSCDVGLRKKTRTCTNQRPDRFGDNCYVHGNWSDWSAWSGCSVSCDVGLQTRARSCDNPKPNKYGEYCSGVGLENAVCLNDPCEVRNGGWSSWGSWMSCSVTCGIGQRSRERTCTNPTPSAYGKACERNFEDVEICLHTPCYIVAFSAHGFNRVSNDVIAFPNVIFNEANAYDNNTGNFTAPVDGIYFFAVSICSTNTNVAFVISMGSATLTNKMLAATGQTNADACASTSTSIRLDRNDHIWVSFLPFSNLPGIDDGGETPLYTFTGSLIQAL